MLGGAKVAASMKGSRGIYSVSLVEYIEVYASAWQESKLV
jgi:hypothetical protein